MKRDKKLLIINHDFPPAGGAGIKRCLKFIKYLPEYGWKIMVLTVKNGNHSIIDTSLLKEVKSDIAVYRAFTFENLFGKETKNTANCDVAAGEIEDSGKMSIKRWLKIVYIAYGRFVKIPDSRILWMPSALVVALRFVLKKQFDAIFATGPTFVNFILASIIKIMSKKPLVIDFRDAWLADPMLINGVEKYLMNIHRMLESFVINQADKVISTNPFVTRDFQERYKTLDSDKFITIYNGYDIDDIAFIKDYKKKPKNEGNFTIVYTGRLYDERTPKHFLKALRMALDEEPKMRSQTSVIFVGSCEKFIDGNHIEDYIEKYELGDIVQLTGHVSRQDSLEYQMKASVLLMVIGIVPHEMKLTYGLSGKVFDYMLSEKPILTLTGEGATKEFLTKNDIGKVFFHEDLDGIKNYLINTYKSIKNGILHEAVDLSEYEKFDFRSLSKTLSEQLEFALNNK